MPPNRALDHIQSTRLIAILRGELLGRELDIAEALVSGGITAIEVSTVTPDYALVISRLQRHFGARAAIGAGTVLTHVELSAVYDAGACFVVSPNTNPDIIQRTRELGMASFPGAFTPTEIVLAAECGADAVKVFPAISLGPEYLRALRGPLPNIQLVPTGGIHLDQVAAYFDAGAFALGIGSELVGKADLASFTPDRLRQKAVAYAEAAKANVHA